MNCMTCPLSGRKPAFALLLPLLLATALVLPALGDPAGVVFTSLYSFTGGNEGAYPEAALVQGGDGFLYGTTSAGGTNYHGTVFKISTNGVLTYLYSFTGLDDGAIPMGALVQGGDGCLYGTTLGGGANYHGTVFKIGTNGVLTHLHSFTGTNDGASPYAGLVLGSDGCFYGTTEKGGAASIFQNLDYGTVFKISTNGILTILYSFSYGNAYPMAALAQGSDGCFCGTTWGNYAGFGINRYGTAFKISTNGVLTNLYSFTGTKDGAHPVGLMPGNDGCFYGTTYGGGAFTNQFGHGCGTVFKVGSDGTLTNLYSFTGASDGACPQAGLVPGRDGCFYGTTFGTRRGPNNGTIFKIDTNGTLVVLHSFGSVLATNGIPLDGGSPLSGLVQANDGSFYGATCTGGTNNQGTIFRLTIIPASQTVALPTAR
jgi:uncharacterized repeat protein (TIGR03803 family)